MLKKKVVVLFVILFLSCSVVGIRAQAIKIRDCGTNVLLGLDNPFPNEPEGLKFYNRGKLTGIKIASSKIDDVRRIFGTPLETSYYGSEKFDYDSDWEILFYYFTKNDKYEERYGKNGLIGGSNYFSDDKENDDTVVKERFAIKPENIGLITAIQFNPKKHISFDSTGFLKKLNPVNSYTRNGRKIYGDDNGLSYQVSDSEWVQLFNSTGKSMTYSRGEVIQIRYDYPCLLNAKGVFYSQIQ